MISSCSLKELEEQKARELKEIRQYQASAVEASLKRKEKALLELQQKFQQLRNDFEYNLKLLEERDKELTQYDEVFEQLKNIINNKSAEISELHIHIDQLTNQIASFERDKADLKQHYTERVAELQQQTTTFQQQCYANADKERHRYEQLCNQLQLRLRQCEEESERIREESGRDLEELLRRKEQDHRIKVDEMVTMVMTKESQIKQLSRQLASCKASLEQTSEREAAGETVLKKMEEDAKKKEWTMSDELNSKDTRIAQLETELQELKCSMKKMRNDYELRHAEMDRKVKEKVVAMAAAKKAHQQSQKQLEDHVIKLKAEVERLKVERRQMEWHHRDELTEAKHAVEKAKGELLVAKQQHSDHVKQISEDHVSHQLQIQSLTESCEQLRTQLVARQQEIEKYQEQVSAGLRREHQLEQSMAQLELDAQQHQEKWQSKQLDHQQQLVEQLTSARDHALATVKKLEGDLLDYSKQISQLVKERDVAMATLQQHGLVLGDQEVTTEVEDHVSLKQQNTELRRVISEMRREMEAMSSDVIKDDEPATIATKGYIEFMEKELALLKAENRRLLTNLENEKLVKSHQDRNHHSDTNRTANQVVTLDAKLLEYSRTISNMEQERLQLMMKCERLASHRRRLEAALQFCHSHSLVMASEEHAHTGATPTHQQLHRKLSKATQVIIELVNQKEQLLIIVNKLRDKLKNNEQKIVNPRSMSGLHDYILCDDGSHDTKSHDARSHDARSHDHKQVVSNTTTPVKRQAHDNHSKTTHHSTPLQHSTHGSRMTRTPSIGSYHGNSHDKQVTSEESYQVTDSFELSCQQHHEALENILTTAAADNLLSSEDDHAPSNKMVVRGKRLGHPPVSVHRSTRSRVNQPKKPTKKPQR